MNKFLQTLVISVFLLVAASFGYETSAHAQNAPFTLILANVSIDAQKIGGGYRASKIIGSSIYNDNNEVIGKVDDIISNPNEHDSYLVIAVGGFLSVGSKLVILPYQNLKITGDKLVLSGATKNALKSLPEFHYAP